MIHKFLIRFLLLPAMAMLLLGLDGCGGKAPMPESSASSSNGFPRTLQIGNEQIAIRARPNRIVSQTLGTDEILWAICPRERIAGVSRIGLDPKYSILAEELKAAKVASIVNAEEILQLQPDLVFVASYSRAETVDQLRAANATIVRLPVFDSLEDIQQNIRLIGQAIGEEAAADALVAKMQSELQAIRARVPKDGKSPRVLSFHPTGNTAGLGTTFDSIVRAAGAVNVAAEKGLQGFPKISAEQVLEWQPDVIITGGALGKQDELRKLLLDNPAIAATEAARKGRIVFLDNRYLLSVSHNVVRAVDDLSRQLYSTSLEAAGSK